MTCVFLCILNECTVAFKMKHYLSLNSQSHAQKQSICIFVSSSQKLQFNKTESEFSLFKIHAVLRYICRSPTTPLKLVALRCSKNSIWQKLELNNSSEDS